MNPQLKRANASPARTEASSQLSTSSCTDTDAQTIEPMLEALIREHGIETVTKHLAILMGQAKWQDWQRVQNLARNIARRLIRESSKI